MSVKVLSIEDDGIALLACEGELDGLQMNEGDTADLQKLLGADWASRRVVLDMSGASYMDSAAIGWLLSLHKKLNDAGGRLVVCGVQLSIKRVIELMRIDRVVTLVDQRDDAVACVRGERSS